MTVFQNLMIYNQKKYAASSMFVSIKVVLIILCLFCSSCMGPNITLKNDRVYEQSIAETTEDYLLGPGDVVEIIYLVQIKPSKEEYILTCGDVIRVEFYYHSELNREIAIGPDGKITLPLKGDIDAAGLAPSQVREKLTTIYGDTFKDPLITITTVEYNNAANELKEAITTSTQGQGKLSTIRPDGYISFPLLEDIRGAGLTLSQLKARVSAEYSKLINNLDISLVLEKAKSNLAYVMGEVRSPGYYLMNTTTTVTQMIATAGGVLDSAKLDCIVVVSRNKEGKPAGKLVNLEIILEEGNIGHDITLKQYDVVYVPKSVIAKADLFVDQYINQLIPKVFRVTFGYDIHREDPD